MSSRLNVNDVRSIRSRDPLSSMFALINLMTISERPNRFLSWAIRVV